MSSVAERARACAAAAPLHQSAAVLRECADALDAKDADLAALREAVGALPEYHYCGYAIGSPLCKKHCLLSPANAALAAARKLAGLGE